MSDAGDSMATTNNVLLTFDDEGRMPLTNEGQIYVGTFRPTNYDPSGDLDIFAHPAPPEPYATKLSEFNGLNPNGIWSLYVMSDGFDQGSIVSGWSLTITTLVAPSSPVYCPPPEGWAYVFDGTCAKPGTGGFTALDGSWSHDNTGDEWDHSPVGGTSGPSNKPGGAMPLDGYLRIQDPGNLLIYGFADPNNRKIYFGKDITADGGSPNILDVGVTLSFRIRVPTNGPLDNLYPTNGTGPAPYPATQGDGYFLHDNGKSGLGISQASGGLISFSLFTLFDTTQVGPGLMMNNRAGAVISTNVDFGESSAATNVMLLNPTQWHEFWITIVGDTTGGGTHRVKIFADGSVASQVFHVTAGTSSDFAGISYLGMGLGNTSQSGALDVDFFAYKEGVYDPTNCASSLYWIGIEMLANHNVLIHFRCLANKTYVLQASSDLLTPTWVNVETNVPSASGPCEFEDAPASPSRFYRIVEQ